MARGNPYEEGRLLTRPVQKPAEASPAGLQALGSEGGPGDGYLYVPTGYRSEDALPLGLLLHGAGEDARDVLAQLRDRRMKKGSACSR